MKSNLFNSSFNLYASLFAQNSSPSESENHTALNFKHISLTVCYAYCKFCAKPNAMHAGPGMHIQ